MVKYGVVSDDKARIGIWYMIGRLLVVLLENMKILHLDKAPAARSHTFNKFDVTHDSHDILHRYYNHGKIYHADEMIN